MAPRALESREQFAARLRSEAASGRTEVRVGAAHHTHAACNEQGVWRLRRLILDRARADEYRKTHSSFMPEHAEMLSEPGPDVVLEAPTLDAFIAALEKARWPLA